MRSALRCALFAALVVGCTEAPSAPKPQLSVTKQTSSPATDADAGASAMAVGCGGTHVVGGSIYCSAGVGVGGYETSPVGVVILESFNPVDGSGFFRAIGGGQATIYAIYPGGYREAVGVVTVHSNISVGISGNAAPPVRGTYSYVATATGGNGSSYHYVWETSNDGGSIWGVIRTQDGGNTDTYVATAGNSPTPGKLRVTVSSGIVPPRTSSVFTINTANTFDAHMTGTTKVTREGGYSFEVMPMGGSGTYTYDWIEPYSSTSKKVSEYYDACDSGERREYIVTVRSGGYAIELEKSVLNWIDRRLCAP